MFLETILTAEKAAINSAYKFENIIVLALDIFRASTSLVNAFDNGLESAFAFVDYQEILAFRQIKQIEENSSDLVNFYFQNQHKVIFGGERNANKVQGFDFGNSPLEYSKENIAGKVLFFSSTNGTRAFTSFPKCNNKFIASFGNADATIDLVLDLVNTSQIEGVIIVCAGSEGNISEEDTYFAGLLADELIAQLQFDRIDTNSSDAKKIYLENKHSQEKYLKSGVHAQRLIQLGYERDIDFAMKANYSKKILKVNGNHISVCN